MKQQSPLPEQIVAVNETNRQHNECEGNVEENDILDEEEASLLHPVPPVPIPVRLVACPEEEVAPRTAARNRYLVAERVQETREYTHHYEQCV